MSTILYDIRTTENAKRTLERITNIPFSVWEKEPQKISNTDEHILYVTNKFHGKIVPFSSYELVFDHLTSSSNGCQSIKQYGLQELPDVYKNTQSELRIFLDKHGIKIFIDEAILSYGSKKFDITYKGSSLFLSDEEKAASRIGYRLYKDKCVCGFLSLEKKRPYMTRVDEKPEILLDIGELIKMDIAEEWKYTHEKYVITSIVDSSCIIPDCDRGTPESQITINYTVLAFWNCFEENERILLCKDGTSILPYNIIGVRPFSVWR